MKTNGSWRIRLTQILLGVAIVIALVVVRGTKAGNEPIHLTTDWSHRHLVFSAPHNLGERVHLLSNPRYNQQLVRRNSEKNEDKGDKGRWHHAPEPNVSLLNGDWSLNMGPGTTVGAGNYPAKFSFDAASANCVEVGGVQQTTPPDFVVYNTSTAGSTTGVAASQTVMFGGNGSSGLPAGTVVITNGATLTLTATGGGSSGTNFHVVTDNNSGNRTANATSLAAAINLAGNGSSVGVSATSAAGVVTITATTGGTSGNSITLTGTIAGSNGVSFGGGTFAGGMDPQATIVALTNLYTGTCSNNTVDVPNSYWVYNTGTTGPIVTSPVLSFDGTQVAFVQNNTVTGGTTLVLLKWLSFDGSFATPTVPASSTPLLYRNCAAPCMLTITFSTANGGAATPDSNSSPFYDYNNDVLYVGDDNGFLHKFTGVFNGATPAEATGVWPVDVRAGSVLTGPLFDQGLNQIFVANDGGFLSRVDATTGVVISSSRVGFTNGINDSPILDVTNGKVYVAVSDDAGGAPGATDVITFAANFANNNPGVKTQLTAQHPGTNIYSGVFDQQWFLGNAGSMYVCAASAGNATPRLYQIDVSNVGALGTVHTGPPLATGTALCSPVTEFFNTNTSVDWIFVSVTTLGKNTAPQSCPTAGAGCLMSWDVTNFNAGSPITATTASAGHVTEAGGTSAVVVDGSSAAAGASQVYFSPLADQPCPDSGTTGGCAIQASQSGLN